MEMLTQKHPGTAARVSAGALPGVIAGLVMAIPMMLYHAAIPGHGIFFPLNLIATWGGMSFEPTGFGPNSIMGFVIHLVFSAILGVIWGLAFTRTPDRTTAAIGGMIYGIIIYWVVEYFAAPIWNPQFTQTIGLPMLIGHLLFGVSFILYPMLVDRLSHPSR